jgi:hypothetical protein
MTEEKTHFQLFIDNTRTSCIITGIGLLVILWSVVGPGKYMLGNSIGKLIGSFILLYAAYTCFSTTTSFVKNEPNIFKDTKLYHEKTNALLSYSFGVLLILLFFYILKKSFW